jgi:nucleoside-diphosphate-sugar epimerase
MENDKDALILVTGGTGFLGSYLLRYLCREGYRRIRALKRPDSPMDLVDSVKDQIEWVEGHLLDIFSLDEAMQDVQQVYHCAALVSFHPADRDRMLQVNRNGTANVVNSCLHAGVEKLVYVSSIAAIGRDRRSPEVSEQTKWQNSPDNSPYAISKFQAEQEVWRGQAEGLNVAVVNPSVILGAGFWHSGPQQVFKMAWEEFPYYPVGSTGFVDVRDVARFMIRLMESDISGQRFLLNGDNTSYREVQTTIAEALDKPPPSKALSPLLARWVARLESLRSKFGGKAPLITKDAAHLTALSYRYINDKSRAALDFEYTPLQQTLEETASAFKEAALNGFGPRVLML